MVKSVNRTARLQWKVDTIKNCKYLQCRALRLEIGAVGQPNILVSFIIM